MRKIWILFLGTVLFWSAAASAQTAGDIAKIEDYLNNIKTLRASFVQTASNGNTSEGKLYIAKPNKLRMEYNPPISVLIVGDGNYIIYNDKELDQVTHIDYDDIPASLILANDVKIDGKKIKVTDFYKDSGTTEIVLEYKEKDGVGPITLVFSNTPFELKQWKVVDPQSVEITVSLYNAETDTALDSSLFKFKNNKNSRSFTAPRR